MTINLLKNERVDDLGIQNYRIIQNPELFCFGIDAVLLSDFAKVKEGKKVLDMGTGTGILPILLAAKTEAGHLTGLEIQKQSVEMARRSVALNELEKRIEIVEGDIKEASQIFGMQSFDVITCNPPYMISQHGLKNPDMPKAIARHEVLLTFEDVAREAAKVLKEGGDFFLVHRPFRLVELFEMLTRHKLEPKKVRFVHPYVDNEPNMVLIHCKKGAKRYVTIDKPLIVYKDTNVYTDEILEIYRLK